MDRQPVSGASNYPTGSKSPASRYHQIDLATRIDGATPHALVTMLYGELGIALDVMARAAAVHDGGRCVQQHERATSILHMLGTSLDRARGGDLAHSLAGIYRQMQRRLAAGRSGDVNAIGEVRAGVASLSDAWATLA